MKIIGLYSPHLPCPPSAKYYPHMWYAKRQPDGKWFVGSCWWKYWNTYNPREVCRKQLMNRPQTMQYRTTLFGRKRTEK